MFSVLIQDKYPLSIDLVLGLLLQFLFLFDRSLSRKLTRFLKFRVNLICQTFILPRLVNPKKKKKKV